ncbi:MAG: ComF family protein [Lachnospiraceae bacterium]|jgi:ComF family protein
MKYRSKIKIRLPDKGAGIFSGRFSENVLDLIFPRHCPFCGKAMPLGSRVHENCIKTLPKITGTRCRICSKPVPDNIPLCEDCSETERKVERVFSPYLYTGSVKNAVIDFKYNNRRENGQVLGELLACESREFIEEIRPDLIAAVPIHPKRRRERGFNQADIIAEYLSGYFGIPILENAVIRTKKTAAMKGLGASERRENLSGAFEGSGVLPEGKKVLIVDDIYTTGSTVDSVGEVLLAMGAYKTYAVTVCIGSSFMIQY